MSPITNRMVADVRASVARYKDSSIFYARARICGQLRPLYYLVAVVVVVDVVLVFVVAGKNF